MVSPEMATFALPLMSKIRLASSPLTESVFSPGPSMVTLWLIAGKSPLLVSVMGTMQPGREHDGGSAGKDARPQRAGTAVEQGRYRKRAEQGPVLQSLQMRQDPRAARGRVLIWGAATESKSRLTTVEPRM